jgi:hypothetical protein
MTTKDPHEIVEINSPIISHDTKIHYAKRGEIISQLPIDEAIDGFQADSQGARTLLTAEEEKKLLRRIDWHLMPLCSLIFLFKNLDSDNVGLLFCCIIHWLKYLTYSRFRMLES